MTQSEAEKELLSQLFGYCKILPEMYKTGQSILENLENFYKQSYRAPLLNDHRAKKMYNDLSNLNNAIGEYMLKSRDDLRILVLDIEDMVDEDD